MSDTFPPCAPDAPITACCITAVPNTSEWMVVCPRGEEVAVAQIPTLSTSGLVVSAVLIAVAAVAMMRGR
jgi:hypothetical protein